MQTIQRESIMSFVPLSTLTFLYIAHKLTAKFKELLFHNRFCEEYITRVHAKSYYLAAGKDYLAQNWQESWDRCCWLVMEDMGYLVKLEMDYYSVAGKNLETLHCVAYGVRCDSNSETGQGGCVVG